MISECILYIVQYVPDHDTLMDIVDILVAGMFPLPFSVVSLFKRQAGRNGKNNGLINRDAQNSGEAYFREMLEGIEDGYYEIDLDGNILNLNTYFCRILGYKKKTIRGENIYSFMNPDSRRRLEEMCAKVFRTGLPVNDFEFEIRRSDGERRIFQSSISLLKDFSNNKIGLRGIARDITDKREREEALLLGERAMSASSNGIIITDPNQTDNPIIYCNIAFLRITGYRRSEVIGKGITILYGPETETKATETMQNAIGKQQECRVIQKSYHKDGTIFWSELALSPVRDSQDNITHFIVLLTDLTERMQGEYKLRESEERFRKLLENALDIVTVISEDGTILYESPAVERVLGYSAARERIGRNLFDYIHPDEVELFRAKFTKFLKEPGLVEKISLRFKHINNSFRMMESICHNLIGDPAIHGIIINSRDITERIKAEEARIDSEQKLSLHIQQTPLAVIEWSTNMEVNGWNPAAEQIFGYTTGKVLGRHAFELMIPESQRDEIRDQWRMLLENKGGTRWTTQNRKSDGTSIFCEWYNTPLVDPNGNVIGIASLVLDVTNRINAETSLRHSEERYRLLFEDDLTGDYITTPDGVILACNRAFTQIFGYPSIDAAIHTNIYDLYPDSTVRQSLLQNLQKEGKLESYELELRRLDGKPVYIIENVVGTFDEKGELVEIKGYMFDNTERKRLERQLIQAQKMQSLGTLAAGVAHDFNNVLSILDGSLSLVKPHVTDESLLKYISMGEIAVQRGADVAGRLLTFARAEDLKLVPFALHTVVKEMEKVLKHTLDKKITIQTEIPESLPFIKGDKGQVYQMMLNLCINARDAILDPENKELGGQISVRAQSVERNLIAEKYRDAAEPVYIKISVCDDGIGMTESVRQQIFDPFFTTKPVGKGTGLGLSVVYGMVKSHKGFIDVESSFGKGTVFDIYLPALVVEPALDTDCAEAQVTGGTETVLIVEDEEMMMTILSEMLKSKGYNIIQARDGVEGLNAFNSHCDTIGMVILDMGLPRLSGQELYKRMKNMRKDVKVIVASGFVDASLKDSLIEDGIKAYIQKPYNAKEMLSVIRQVFDESK
jgi:two-component system, cell cycle sensor histidine kinase and response regulator CckA